MSPIEVTIHGTGIGACALTGKESEGLTVSFGDGTVQQQFLSWRALRQLLAMKCGKPAQVPSKPPAASTGSK